MALSLYNLFLLLDILECSILPLGTGELRFCFFLDHCHHRFGLCRLLIIIGDDDDFIGAMLALFRLCVLVVGLEVGGIDEGRRGKGGVGGECEIGVIKVVLLVYEEGVVGGVGGGEGAEW